MSLSSLSLDLDVEKTLIMTAERINKKGNLLATIPKLSWSYSVKFDFKPTQFQSGWTNIIHLTAFGKNMDQYGDRIPAVFLQSSSTTATKNKLHIYSAVNGDKNHAVSSDAVVAVGEWTTIEISQHRDGDSYIYTVKVKGVELESVINTQPREFTNVKVYGADPWQPAAQGSMRNLVIEPNVKGVLFIYFFMWYETIETWPNTKFLFSKMRTSLEYMISPPVELWIQFIHFIVSFVNETH